MRETNKILTFLFFLALGSLLGVFLGINFPYDYNSVEEKFFSVEQSQGLFAIARNLKKENLIKQEWFFDIAVFLQGGVRKLQAGDYRLSQTITPFEIAKKIISGDIAKKILTIPEGWNLKDIDSYLKSKGISDFLANANKDYSAEFDFLADKPKNLSLEGYFFPDTYQIKAGNSSEDLIKTALANFDKKLTLNLRSEIEKQGRTIFEIVNMASLLEKEVKTIEDKKIVSGILWKRLKIGMRLQVDATIVYALEKEPGSVSYDDLKVDSPYNTYKYAGLPLGPIANPGLDSIMAAIYPQETSNWYYLSAPDNKTYFSQTLEQHNLKKVKYLK